MLQNQEHIKDLILFEFAGHIREHQLAYLNACIEEDPEIALLRQQMFEKFNDPRLQAVLKRLESFKIEFLKKMAKKKTRLYVNRRNRIRKRRLYRRSKYGS